MLPGSQWEQHTVTQAYTRQREKGGGSRVFRLGLGEAEFVKKQVLNIALDGKIGYNPHVCRGKHGRAVL